MKISVIFDNTVFNIAARIQCCDLITLAVNLFDNILVPEQISKEVQQFPLGYEPFAEQRMQYYFSRIRPNAKGLQLCISFDKIVLAMLESKDNVDKGEAEAIAQAEKRNVKWFFTDDERCVLALEPLYNHIFFVSTLYLIALLDIQKLLPNYDEVLKQYFTYKPLPTKNKDRRITLTKFRTDYQKAASHFGVFLDKKEISKKTSVKRLGLI